MPRNSGHIFEGLQRSCNATHHHVMQHNGTSFGRARGAAQWHPLSLWLPLSLPLTFCSHMSSISAAPPSARGLLALLLFMFSIRGDAFASDMAMQTFGRTDSQGMTCLSRVQCHSFSAHKWIAIGMQLRRRLCDSFCRSRPPRFRMSHKHLHCSPKCRWWSNSGCNTINE